MIVFLGGNNDYAIAQHIAKLRDQYRRKYADALEAVDCDLTQITLPALKQQLLALPMFYSHRLVTVRSLVEAQAYIEDFLALLQEIPESTVAVLDGRDMDRRSKLYKSLAAIPTAKVYETLSEGKLVQWLIKEAKRAGADLDRATAHLLIKRAGMSQWRLHHELTKLTVAGGTIDRSHIEELVSTDPTSSVFDLIATVQSGDAQRAIRLYDELMKGGASEQQLLAMLQWHFRVLTLVYHRATPAELSACGVKPYAASRAQQQATRCTEAQLAQSYQALLDADVAMKSGIKKPHQAMTDLVLSLTLGF
ncbi:DNA polymerase III subunit delta [bacterium]|nr:DNA polymerase III subunit delta [bacterium]